MVSIATHTTVNRTVHLSNIIRAQYASGRIALPQNGGLYSRFKHIQGVPAQSSDGGYSVNKLRMIDQLVERLVRLKGHAPAATNQAGDSDPDALIAKYAADLAKVLHAADTISPSVTAGMASPGMLFNLVA
jgi:hypothetical protein